MTGASLGLFPDRLSMSAPPAMSMNVGIKDSPKLLGQVFNRVWFTCLQFSMARRRCGVGVLIPSSDPSAATLGLLVAALRDDIEVVVAHVEHVEAARVCRVGVIHLP